MPTHGHCSFLFKSLATGLHKLNSDAATMLLAQNKKPHIFQNFTNSKKSTMQIVHIRNTLHV